MSQSVGSSKNVAAAYLEMLNNTGSGNQAPTGPLFPKKSLNMPSTPKKSSPSPIFDINKVGKGPNKLMIPGSGENIHLFPVEDSFSALNLDSPSPLKRTSRPLFKSNLEQNKNMGSHPSSPSRSPSPVLGASGSSISSTQSFRHGGNPKFPKGYEYLCRISEVKRWIESIIDEEIPSVLDLANDSLRDGAILAKLVVAFNPKLIKKINAFNASAHRFLNTENITGFFRFLDSIQMPDLFKFELGDLYDKKNIPKVIFCIHTLSYMLAQNGSTKDMIDLTGELNFTEEEIKSANKLLGSFSFPNFDQMHKQFNRQLPKNTPSLQQAPIVKLTPSSPTREEEPNNSSNVTKPSFSEKDSAKPNKGFPSNPFLEADQARTHQPETFTPLEYHKPKVRQSSRESMKTRIDSTVECLDDEIDFTSSLKSGFAISTGRKPFTKSEFIEVMIRFQSIARGSIYRYAMFFNKFRLNSVSDDIIQFQSLVRRALVRKRYNQSSNSFTGSKHSIISLQSVIRAQRERGRLVQITSSQPDDKIVELQSISRGESVRMSVKKIKYHLMKYDHQIISLQSIARGSKIFSRTQNSIQAEEPIIKLQAQIRRVLHQKEAKKSQQIFLSEDDVISIIQSVSRGSTVRKLIAKKMKILQQNQENLLELQSIIRGGFLRSSLNFKLDIVDTETPKLGSLCAIAKGRSVRQNIQRINTKLNYYSPIIVQLQSRVRGVLSRYQFDLFLDNLDLHTWETICLQSSIRGYLYRKSKSETLKYYEEHLPEVIKIQSAIRGKYLKNAYKSLQSTKDPPLSGIKEFAHLLNDSDLDFDEEVQLTRLKEKLVEKTSLNESLEKQITQLDLKIALLQKNKISMEELVSEKETGSEPFSRHLATIDITSLNRRAKTRMESYEKLFYLLQTQPGYLSRLVRHDYRGVNVVLKIFNNVEVKDPPTREEYLFVHLIETCLKDSLQRMGSIDELAAESSPGWFKLLSTFNESLKDEISELFGPLVQNLFNDSELNMESDPVKIYQSIYHSESDIVPQEAIADPDTRTAFINNLQEIREYGSEVYRILNTNLDKIPIHMKVIARTAFKTSSRKFPQNSEKDHLAISGYILVSGFINLILQSPEQFDIYTLDTPLYAKKNLRMVSKLLIHLFMMRPFGAEDSYLQPLNKFIDSSTEGVRSLLKSFVAGDDIDTTYGMTVYDDFIARNRPKLTLRIADLLSIDQLIKKQLRIVAPSSEDTLREVYLELQSNKVGDLSELTGSFTLSLNPSSYKTSPEEIRLESLFIQAKRCVLYMVQVQDDQSDLFRLLVSKIDPIHEIKFNRIISLEEKDIESNHVNDYVNDGQGFLGDLTKISYKQLKQIALERILDLESIGKVTRNDSFQIILNEIAYDIKTKYEQRISRKRQLLIAQNTLVGLEEKHTTLANELKSYNRHIQQAMETIQSKPTKQKKILPFTKQYFYERELKKVGKLPKFGAFKYSAKNLYEKGIIVELQGATQDLGSSFFGGLNFPKVDFMFNCDTAGVFTISCKSTSLPINGDIETLTIDQMLEYQYENKAKISLFNNFAKFDTNHLMQFILKKFYHHNEVR